MRKWLREVNMAKTKVKSPEEIKRIRTYKELQNLIYEKQVDIVSKARRYIGLQADIIEYLENVALENVSESKINEILKLKEHVESELKEIYFKFKIKIGEDESPIEFLGSDRINIFKNLGDI